MSRLARRRNSAYTRGVSFSSALSSPRLQARSHPVTSSREAVFMPVRCQCGKWPNLSTAVVVLPPVWRISARDPHSASRGPREVAMRCVVGIAVLCLIAGASASALEDRTDAQALTLRLTFPDRVAVRLGLGLALQRLDRPGCSAIYDEFQLPDGCTPRCELDRRRIGPRELLKTLV